VSSYNPAVRGYGAGSQSGLGEAPVISTGDMAAASTYGSQGSAVAVAAPNAYYVGGGARATATGDATGLYGGSRATAHDWPYQGRVSAGRWRRGENADVIPNRVRPCLLC
jgi:hypothetical protein